MEPGVSALLAGPSNPAGAIVFASSAEAGRKVAGIPAVGRICRQLAASGTSRVTLVLPAGDKLPQHVEDEIKRLAPGVAVEIATAVPPGSAPILRGDRLVFGGHTLDPRRWEASLTILRESGKASDGPVSRWLNRPVSRVISTLLLRLPGIRPVHATAGTILIALIMFALLVGGTRDGLVAGALLFHAASVFDGVDGEIARATFRCTRSGAVLDTVVDVATNVLLILGITINLAARGAAEAPFIAGWGFLLFLAGLAVIAWRSAQLDGPFSLDLVKRLYGRRFRGPVAGSLIRFLTIVSSRDFFALLFALLVVAGVPMAVLYLFAAAATVWILFVAASFLMPAAEIVPEPQL